MDTFQRFLGPFVLFALLGLAWKLTTEKKSKDDSQNGNIKIGIEIDNTEKKSFGIHEEGYEERMHWFLEEQAKCTLELFRGIDEETKNAVIKKFSEFPIFYHTSKQYEKEMFALFEGKDFVWEEYEYLKKIKEQLGFSSNIVSRWCKKETPFNIIRVFIWTVRMRAYDVESRYKLQGVFDWSAIGFTFEEDIEIYRLIKDEDIPWKHAIHPVLPGLMTIRHPVCEFDFEENKKEFLKGGKFEFLEKVD